jgi:chaperonin GroES
MSQSKTLRLIPLHDKLLIKQRKRKEISKGGLVIPDTAMAYERPEEGWVVAVNEKSSFQEGELVFFTKYVGVEIKVNGDPYLIMSEHQAVGKVPVNKQTEDEQKEYAEICASQTPDKEKAQP